MTFQLPDPSTPFGERVAHRLHNEAIIWLTVVSSNGTPQPAPVWFLWDDATQTFLIYSQANAKRETHLRANPRVSLNFDGNGTGGDIVVFTGEAQFSTTDPPADQMPVYVEKYKTYIANLFGTPEQFATLYPVVLRIKPRTVRGH
jgi:PPOX class probable F420-dependent enzyme